MPRRDAMMVKDPELAEVLEQAARNLKTLELLVGLGQHSTLEEMRARINRLREAYTRETNSLTRQVLRRAIERRRGIDRRKQARDAPPTAGGEPMGSG